MTVQLDIVVLKLALRKEKSVGLAVGWGCRCEYSCKEGNIVFTVKLHSCL